MNREDGAERAKIRRKPVKPRVASRPELRGSLDRVVTRIDARHGDNRFGAAIRAGNLVRQMRREAGLSQRALGKALGVSQARISEIEAGAGIQGPTWMLMERIAFACGRNIGLAPEAGVTERKEAGLASGRDMQKPASDDEAIETLHAAAATKFGGRIETALKLRVDPRHADQDVHDVVTVRIAAGKAGFAGADLRRNLDAFVDTVGKAKLSGRVTVVKVKPINVSKAGKRHHGSRSAADAPNG